MTLIEPPPRDPLNGTERFTGLEGVVEDFWRFALPSLMMNNVRGWFAEYLVCRALGMQKPVRTEWDAFDVLWGTIRIEVKSTAYVQQWAQRGPSTLSFSGLCGKLLDPETNTYADESTYNADIYVLAAHLTPGHDSYDQLDVTQWRFAVATRAAIAATGQASMAWSTATKLATRVVGFDELAEAISEAARA